MKKTKWLLYTVLIGLIPFLTRLLIYLVRTDLKGGYILNEVDMIAFGLILNVSNINELDGNNDIDKDWKTVNLGLSLFFIIIFAIFLGVSYLSSLPKATDFDVATMKWLSFCTSLGSLLFSYSIFKRFV